MAPGVLAVLRVLLTVRQGKFDGVESYSGGMGHVWDLTIGDEVVMAVRQMVCRPASAVWGHRSLGHEAGNYLCAHRRMAQTLALV